MRGFRAIAEQGCRLDFIANWMDVITQSRACRVVKITGTIHSVCMHDAAG